MNPLDCTFCEIWLKSHYLTWLCNIDNSFGTAWYLFLRQRNSDFRFWCFYAVIGMSWRRQFRFYFDHLLFRLGNLLLALFATITTSWTISRFRVLSWLWDILLNSWSRSWMRIYLFAWLRSLSFQLGLRLINLVSHEILNLGSTTWAFSPSKSNLWTI